jgi:hypothetical protein
MKYICVYQHCNEERKRFSNGCSFHICIKHNKCHYPNCFVTSNVNNLYIIHSCSMLECNDITEPGNNLCLYHKNEIKAY